MGPAHLHDNQRKAETQFETKIEAKIAALEERVRSVPGKLPVARTWTPQTVVYQAEFVSHEGALWQAKTDTATAPGGDAWLCVARAGRDAITPHVRNTYNAYEKYRHLDIVVMDGGSFIARKDNPGICPGPYWQMIAQRGKTGRPGAPGARGNKGEKGEPGVVPKLVSSEIDKEYNLVILRSDDSLEIIPLLEGFERYNADTSE